MTNIECLQYLIDCTGDCDSESADSELRSDVSRIRGIVLNADNADSLASICELQRSYPKLDYRDEINKRLSAYLSQKMRGIT